MNGFKQFFESADGCETNNIKSLIQKFSNSVETASQDEEYYLPIYMIIDCLEQQGYDELADRLKRVMTMSNQRERDLIIINILKNFQESQKWHEYNPAQPTYLIFLAKLPVSVVYQDMEGYYGEVGVGYRIPVRDSVVEEARSKGISIKEALRGAEELSNDLVRVEFTFHMRVDGSRGEITQVELYRPTNTLNTVVTADGALKKGDDAEAELTNYIFDDVFEIVHEDFIKQNYIVVNDTKE